MPNMDNIIDESFDPEFDKIENLTWYPWIGVEYPKGMRRVLIVGDSHYAVDDKGNFDQECYDDFMLTKKMTRYIVERYLKGETWNFYQNLENTFLDSSGFWSKIAFYNFIQHPMKQNNAIPDEQEYLIAWRCFVDLVKVLKPTDCIFIGVRSETCFGYSCHEMGIKYTIEDMPVIINRTHPRKANIVLSDTYSVDLYFIRHTSQYYSPDQWNGFLKQQVPEAMEWLNNK